MSILDVTICRQGEGKMVADFLPPPVCFADVVCYNNHDGVQSQESRGVTFFAPAGHMVEAGGLLPVIDHIFSFRKQTGDRLAIEADWKAKIEGINDPRIGAWNDLREDGAYLYFLQKCRNVSVDRGVVSALTENTGLSDSMKRTLREDLARLIIVESFTGRISRNRTRVRVYELIALLAEGIEPVDIVRGFHELCDVYPSIVLLRIVASFLARVVAFQCGNRSYMKSMHAQLIRSASNRFTTRVLVEGLMRIQSSPLAPEDVFADFVLRTLGSRSQ